MMMKPMSCDLESEYENMRRRNRLPVLCCAVLGCTKQFIISWSDINIIYQHMPSHDRYSGPGLVRRGYMYLIQYIVLCILHVIFISIRSFPYESWNGGKDVSISREMWEKYNLTKNPNQPNTFWKYEYWGRGESFLFTGEKKLILCMIYFGWLGVIVSEKVRPSWDVCSASAWADADSLVKWWKWDDNNGHNSRTSHTGLCQTRDNTGIYRYFIDMTLQILLVPLHSHKFWKLRSKITPVTCSAAKT